VNAKIVLLKRAGDSRGSWGGLWFGGAQAEDPAETQQQECKRKPGLERGIHSASRNEKPSVRETHEQSGEHIEAG